MQHLSAARAPRHKRPIAILTPARPIVRAANASRTHTLVPSLALLPEKRPAVLLVLHLPRRLRRLARIGVAVAVRCAVRGVVLVVRLEDGEGLGGGGAGVVAALGGLDGRGDFGCLAVLSGPGQHCSAQLNEGSCASCTFSPIVGFRATALGVAQSWVERGIRARQRERESDEGLELHGEGERATKCGKRATGMAKETPTAENRRKHGEHTALPLYTRVSFDAAGSHCVRLTPVF